ncbi:DUF1707 domain-containing protein [Phytohabitans flavus]|uniref:DUF1707 domain-containing protein n=1 Tax=Phytohabitans flavus TaxID=1076124 RepID=A0A6F8XUQ8_9ACTN|nr:DUF1707 domain-containing protein [Phytohabitans flavus]BCB77527.1 hypothetical protein Pflav_039370 [Phytohabitans flavus]
MKEPQDTPTARLALRVGTPELDAAAEALAKHVGEKRIDSAEYERRMEAAKTTTTQGELLQIFADLPAPHPDLPGVPEPLPLRKTGDGDDDIPIYAAACALAILLGEPVAIVLAIVYDAWWLIAIPVAFCVLLVTGVAIHDRLRRH